MFIKIFIGIIVVLISFSPIYGQQKEKGKNLLEWKRQPSLISRWSEGLRCAEPLPQYPRPQMVRTEWMNLNGVWDFLGEGSEPPELPRKFPEQVLVPSATQAITSCLEKEWTYGWYRRTIDIPAAWEGKKVLLHFEAVGGVSTVYFNARELGKSSNSFNRFSFELSEFKAGKKNEILLFFDDRNPALARGIPNYSEHLAGIWQSVWMEPVQGSYISFFKQTPDIDAGKLKIDFDIKNPGSNLTLVATVGESERIVATSQGACDESLVLNIENPKLWSPESPFLYDLTLELKKGDKVIDHIKSYFGMRKIETSEVDGVPRIFLNNKVYYQIGLLDLGTWPESYLTAPSDDALKWEIETAKNLGFNVLRKHQKVEANRWYYWCDLLGMLVWQDLPCQLYFHDKPHKTEADKQLQRDAMHHMIEQLYNHPSIICWVIFNESWGQFEPREMTIKARNLDSSRLIDATSHVWPNKLNRKRYNVDFYDFHCYSRNLSLGEEYGDHIPSALGEFGGIPYKIEGHVGIYKKDYHGYGEYANSSEELLCNYKSLILQACELRKTQNLSAVIYTQLTDYLSEINGFITYDRKVIKVDTDKLRQINKLFTETK